MAATPTRTERQLFGGAMAFVAAFMLGCAVLVVRCVRLLQPGPRHSATMATVDLGGALACLFGGSIFGLAASRLLRRLMAARGSDLAGRDAARTPSA